MSVRELPRAGAAMGADRAGVWPAPASRSRRRRSDFLARTISDLSLAMENAVFADDLCRRPGMLQDLDPRLKVVLAALFLGAIAFAHQPATLAGLYLLTLVTAAASGLPLGVLLKRVGIVVPLFTGVLALPALFLTPGRELLPIAGLQLGSLGPVALTVSEQGVRTALLLVLRSSASVSLVMLLMLTTPWPDLLKALRVLRVPQAFVLILSTTHRYIFLLLHTANGMFLARESRRVGCLSGSEDRRWIAAAMGQLLVRSFHMSEEVYLAMVSRGFRGELGSQGLGRLRWRARDGWATAAALLLAVLALWADRGLAGL